MLTDLIHLGNDVADFRLRQAILGPDFRIANLVIGGFILTALLSVPSSASKTGFLFCLLVVSNVMGKVLGFFFPGIGTSLMPYLTSSIHSVLSM